MKKILFSLLAFLGLISFNSCNNYTHEEKEYINSIEENRNVVDEWMKDNQNSPFNYKGKVEYSGLKYFDVDPDFVFKSKFIEYDEKVDIPILGTKGEKRAALRIGYLSFNKDNKDYKLNVYANMGQDSSVYYSIWFTDKTTSRQTYGVGRYLSFELDPNKDHIYTIDFNLAFNPYCAYNANYSCAIPSQDDYLDLAVTAGEKIYHD